MVIVMIIMGSIMLIYTRDKVALRYSLNAVLMLSQYWSKNHLVKDSLGRGRW